MQINTTKKAIMMAAIILVMFTSCKKGDTGPAGKDGNANVIATNSTTINPNQWSFDGYSFTVALSTPGITQEVLNSGAIMVYMSDGQNSWVQLPYVDYNYYTEFIATPGTITIVISTVDEETPAVDHAFTFRTVIIPSSARKAHPEVDYSNYLEVVPLIDNSKALEAVIN